MNNSAFVVFALLAAAPLSAREIKIAADGSGDYKKLSEALTAAKPGDLVTVVDVGTVGLTMRKDGATMLVNKAVGAALQAGVTRGSRILRIDGESVSTLDGVETMARLAGPVGSTVDVEYEASETGKTATATLVRHAFAPFTITKIASKFELANSVGNREAAFQWIEAAAEDGNAFAQGALANAYYNGKGMTQDYGKAARWAQQAARANLTGPQRLLGIMYLKGRGVTQDFAEAERWLTRAAQKGDSLAAYNLGLMYLSGSGVDRSPAKAAEMFEKAAAGRVPGAGESLEKARAAMASGGSDAGKVKSDKQTALSKAEVRAMMAEAIDEIRQKPAAAKPAAASDVDKPSYSKSERPDDFAVVVGVQKYATIPEATFAENDADAVRAHMAALGVPQRNIFFLKGPQATKSAFTKELEARLPRVTTSKSTVYFYFSGHGAPNPKSGDAYLMPYDGDPEFLEETGYPLKRLYAKLAALPAKRVIVTLDSCFSGAGGRSVLAKGVRPLVTKTDVAPQVDGRVIALTAASGSQISGTFDEEGHGLFTYYFLKGLNDGAKTLGDLQSYVKPRVADEARRHNRDQTPSLFGAGAAQVELR